MIQRSMVNWNDENQTSFRYDQVNKPLTTRDLHRFGASLGIQSFIQNVYSWQDFRFSLKDVQISSPRDVIFHIFIIPFTRRWVTSGSECTLSGVTSLECFLEFLAWVHGVPRPYYECISFLIFVSISDWWPFHVSFWEIIVSFYWT